MPQDALARVIDRGIAEGLDDAELRLLVQEFTTPPAGATAGMPAMSRPTDPPEQRLGALGIRTVSDEDWGKLSRSERMVGLLQAGGKALATAAGMGRGGEQAVEHPGTTLTGAAIGAALPFAASHGPQALRAGASTVADVLDNPVVGGALGAEEGGRHSGWDWRAMLMGGVGGALGSSSVARGIRKVAGVTPSSAGPDLIAGMSEAGRPVPPAVARGKQLEQLLRSGSLDDLTAFVGAPAPTPAPPAAAATATPSDALARELLAREIDWRITDAVPIDAMKRALGTKGGSIIDAGESIPGLGERMAVAMKTGNQPLADTLARAIRQRMHITEKVRGR